MADAKMSLVGSVLGNLRCDTERYPFRREWQELGSLKAVSSIAAQGPKNTENNLMWLFH